jgi:hypothetical protein
LIRVIRPSVCNATQTFAERSIASIDWSLTRSQRHVPKTIDVSSKKSTGHKCLLNGALMARRWHLEETGVHQFSLAGRGNLTKAYQAPAWHVNSAPRLACFNRKLCAFFAQTTPLLAGLIFHPEDPLISTCMSG